MALQMRRGLEADFDETQMLPGEWAVATDKQRIWMCCSKQANGTVEVPTIVGIKTIEDKCKEYADDSKEYADNSKAYSESAEASKNSALTYKNSAENYSNLSKSYAVGTNNVTRAGDSEDNAKYYKEWVENAFNIKLPTITMDFTTGKLLYVGGVVSFDLNTTTGMLEWYM